MSRNMNSVARWRTLLLVVSATILLGCQSPQITERFDQVKDELTVMLGPLDIAGEFFGSLRLQAKIPGHFSPHRPPKVVHATFEYVSFRLVTMRADGAVIKARRQLFGDYTVRFTAEDFARIARAERITGRFDSSETEFAIEGQQRDLVRQFARRVYLLEEAPPPEESGAGTGGRAVAPAPRPDQRIHDLQGRTHLSPRVGESVSGIKGLVTRVEERGFFFEDDRPDGDPGTSEGLFVFTSDAPTVRVADRVQVAGLVSEFCPGGKKTGNLSTTQLSEPRVEVLARGVKLPEPVVIGQAGRSSPASCICDDSVDGDVEDSRATFDPSHDGIDFYESLESMRVELRDVVVVGATSRYAEIWVVPDEGRGARPRSARGGMLLRPDDANPERVQLQFASDGEPKAPAARVGDRLARVRGVLSYAFGNFEVRVESVTKLESGALPREKTALRGDASRVTVATYNVLNLAATEPERILRVGRQIVEALGSPDVVALQEIQDDSGVRNDGVVSAAKTFEALSGAIVTAGGPRYEFRQLDPADNQDGGQPGGNIRVGFLFRPARVSFVDRVAGSDRSPSPARIGGGLEPFENSRKSLYGEFRFRGRTLHVIANHLSSKSGSLPIFGRVQPAGDRGLEKRLAQARHVRSVVDSLCASDPHATVVVLGDMNDFEFSRPIEALRGEKNALVNLVDSLPEAERYTYVYQGNAQVLDHILVSADLARTAEVDVVHVNSEFPDGVSDHDPVVARFSIEGPR